MAVWLWLPTGLDQQFSAMPGLTSTSMGDRLMAGKPPRCRTTHPHLLSLAILPWVGATSTTKKGNRRSDVAPVMRHRQSWFICGLNGLWKGDEHPAYAPSEDGSPLPFLYVHCIQRPRSAWSLRVWAFFTSLKSMDVGNLSRYWSCEFICILVWTAGSENAI